MLPPDVPAIPMETVKAWSQPFRDKTYAHKISLAYNPKDDGLYMYYCAVGEKGRGIALLTKKPLPLGHEIPPLVSEIPSYRFLPHPEAILAPPSATCVRSSLPCDTHE